MRLITLLLLCISLLAGCKKKGNNSMINPGSVSCEWFTKWASYSYDIEGQNVSGSGEMFWGEIDTSTCKLAYINYPWISISIPDDVIGRGTYDIPANGAQVQYQGKWYKNADVLTDALQITSIGRDVSTPFIAYFEFDLKLDGTGSIVHIRNGSIGQ